MAYIGKKVEETDLTNRTVDTMVGDGSDTTLTLSATPISVNNVLVFINGIMQRPTTDYTISGTTLTFGTAPFTGGIVVAITGGGEHIGVPLAKIATDKISDGAVTNAKINSLSASKITGALPALDGSALTGGAVGFTESVAYPAIDTNPSGGVGTIWVNTSTGDTYCCTDATTDANVWRNIGTGQYDTTHAYGGMGGGTAYGFASCGSVPGLYLSLINRFSFASGVAQAWGNATLARDTLNATGASSSTHGFVLNGNIGSTSTANNVIDKFPFASSAGATDFGDLNFQRGAVQCSYDSTRAYISGGRQQASPPHFTDRNIQTFLFANNSSNTNHGDLTADRQWLSSASSKTHGYVMGGGNDGGIDKFAFASSGASRMSGDLNGGVATTRFQFGSSGHSSDTRGYNAGGTTLNAFIDSFSFASDSAAGTSHSNLVKGTYMHAGSSSTTHGFLAGEDGGSTLIQRFAFGNNTLSADVGDLTRTYGSAQGNED